MGQKDRMLLAVLIDADNIPAKFASAILKEITRFGDPALRRVYGDWSSDRLQSWKKEVARLGLDAIQETANTKGKNASDIGLVIDAMDILHKGRFDGFVLVSSDSDFTALANRLREDGVDVIGIGEGKAPASLRNVCNRFILIENLNDMEKSAGQGDADKEPNGKKAGDGLRATTEKAPASKVVPLVIKAMNALDPEGEWYNLSPLGKQLNVANPDFDPRTYGRSKLSELLVLTGQFEVRRTASNQTEMRRKT